MDNPSFFAILPAHVRYDSRLSAAEKILFAEITALSNVDGFCFAKNAYFAGLYKVEERTVRRWLSNLSGYGYIRVDTLDNGQGRRIWPITDASDGSAQTPDKNVLPPDKNVLPPGQKCPIPPDKNVPHTFNSTSNNNISNTSTKKRNEDSIAKFAGTDTQLLAALEDFRADRAERKKPMTSRACQLLCKRLTTLADEAGVYDRHGYMIYLLRYATEVGWQTVFARDGFKDRPVVHQATGPAVDRPRVVDASTDVMDIL